MSGTGGAARKPGPSALLAAARGGGRPGARPERPGRRRPSAPGGDGPQTSRRYLPPVGAGLRPAARQALRSRRRPDAEGPSTHAPPAPRVPAAGTLGRASSRDPECSALQGQPPGARRDGQSAAARARPSPGRRRAPKGPMGAAARPPRPAPPDVAPGTWPPPVPGP